MKTLQELEARIDLASLYTKNKTFLQIIDHIKNSKYCHDLDVSPFPAQIISDYCDDYLIPCFIVNKNTISTAPTYLELYLYETRR